MWPRARSRRGSTRTCRTRPGRALRAASPRATSIGAPSASRACWGSWSLSARKYHCVACQVGFCPRDRALGLAGSSLSPGVLRIVGRVGALISFEEAHEWVALAGVRVPTKHVERAAEALGPEIAHDERTLVKPPAAGEPVAPTVYLGMDGTGVPIRKENLAGRAANSRTARPPHARSSSARFGAPRGWTSTARRCATRVDLLLGGDRERGADGHRRTPSAFAARVERAATWRGFDRAARRAVLGDGAKWIWNLADEYFPVRRRLAHGGAPRGPAGRRAGCRSGTGGEHSRSVVPTSLRAPSRLVQRAVVGRARALARRHVPPHI